MVLVTDKKKKKKKTKSSLTNFPVENQGFDEVSKINFKLFNYVVQETELAFTMFVINNFFFNCALSAHPATSFDVIIKFCILISTLPRRDHVTHDHLKP